MLGKGKNGRLHLTEGGRIGDVCGSRIAPAAALGSKRVAGWFCIHAATEVPKLRELFKKLKQQNKQLRICSQAPHCSLSLPGAALDVPLWVLHEPGDLPSTAAQMRPESAFKCPTTQVPGTM